MTQNSNENKTGFSNLKSIHSLQVGGVLQEILKDLRNKKLLIDNLQKKALDRKKALLNDKLNKEEKVVEKESPITDLSNKNTNNNQNKNQVKTFNNKRVFDNKQQYQGNRSLNQNYQKPNERKFQNDRKDFKNQNFNNKKQTNNVRPQNNSFVATKANNFKNFAQDEIKAPTEPVRNFGNKNKTKQVYEKKTLNKKALVRRNILVDDNIEIDDDAVRMGSRKLAKSKKKDEIKVVNTEIKNAIITSETVTVKVLSEKTGKPVTEIIKKLMLLGIMATINSAIDFATAELICSEFDITLEQKLDKTYEEQLLDLGNNAEQDNLETRPPVVTVMGHVDHGKTSLLDYIRKTNIATGEAGGITQRIGAYQISAHGQKITFIDTPGHAAFTAMRARGAKVTDIAVLVVAADDGIMPQTIEAINHIKAANVPMIVAINKIDKSEANIERVKQQLTEHGVLPEEWGGDAIIVPVSAKTGLGIDNLINMILLVAEMQELKANPNTTGSGTVIEAELDKNRGPIASVLVSNGTLKVGDTVVAGITFGKIKAMFDENGKAVKVAEPSTPVAILGFNEVPSSGDMFYAVSEKLSKQVIEERITKLKNERANQTSGVSLDDFMDRVNEGKLKNLNIIIKADVQGSVEALRQTLTAIRNEEVKVVCIHSAAGAVTESDVILAQASNAIIINFNLKVPAKVEALANNIKTEIKSYKIIYEAVDDITNAITGLMTVKYEQVVVGHAEVRVVFKLSSQGIVAGSYITDGKAIRNACVRILRNGELIADTSIDSLKIMKDDKAEVNYGYECGIKLKDSQDIKEGDILEIYQNVPIKR